MKKPYKQIEHTGDAGIIAYGNTKEELFINAARGMFSILMETDNAAPKTAREIELEGEDPEDLLVRWLSEINYLVSTEREVYSHFQIERMSETHLCALIKGEPIDPERHGLLTEIKAVTYHEIYLKKTDDGFEARVIFDL